MGPQALVEGHELPEDLKWRVVRYVAFKYEHADAVHADELHKVMQEIPHSLVAEFALQSSGRLLRGFPCEPLSLSLGQPQQSPGLHGLLSVE